MENTARKHEFADPVVNSLFNDYKAQGVVSNLILKSMDEIMVCREHLAGLRQSATDAQKKEYDNSISMVDAIIKKKIEISASVYGVSEVVPTVHTPVTEAKPDKKDADVRSLLPDLGEKPEQRLVSDTVKSLLQEGKRAVAESVVNKYYGTGNFTPKKGKKAEPWDEAKRAGWLKEIEKHIKPNSKKEEKTEKSDLNKEMLIKAGIPESDVDLFGSMCDTLEEERLALDNFSVVVAELSEKGSEDIKVRDILLTEFFKNRHYSQKKIQAWVDYVKDDKKTDVDHWKYLGVPGENSELLGNAPSYKDMEDAVIEKIQNGVDKETVLNTLSSKITGFTVLDEKGHNYELYTVLHARDFLQDIYDAKYGEHKPTEKKGDDKGEVSARTDTNTNSSEKDSSKENGAEDAGSQPTKSGETNSSENKDDIIPLPVDRLKKLTLGIVRSGGIVDDVMLLPEVEELTVTGLRMDKEVIKFETFEDEKETKAKIKEVIEPIFNEVFEAYEKKKTKYPFGQMMGALRFNHKNELSIEDTVKQYIDLIKKTDGTFIPLTGKDMEPIVIKSEKEFTTFVEEKFALFTEEVEAKKAKDAKTLADIEKKQEQDRLAAKSNENRKIVDERLAEINNKDEKKEDEKPKKFRLKDHMYDIESMNDLKAIGLKIIRAGGTMDDIKQWARSKIMNVRLKEMDEESVFKTTVQMDTFIEGFFKTIIENDKPPETLTEEEIVAEIVELWDQEDANLANVTTKIKEYLKDNNTEMSVNDLHGLIKENRPVVETEVIPKISESNKELYEIVKSFTTLEEIHNQVKEMIANNARSEALAMCIELVVDTKDEAGNCVITDADGWTTEQITGWFEKMFPLVEKKQEPEDAQIVNEEKPKEDESSSVEEDKSEEGKESTGKWDFSPALTATKKPDWKAGVITVLKNAGDLTPEFEAEFVKQIMAVTDKTWAKNAIARNGEKAVSEIVHNFVEKFKEATK